MKRMSLSLGEETIDLGRDLAERYGWGANLSSVVRRAVHLLAEHWESLDGKPRATTIERSAMFEYLSESRRGNATQVTATKSKRARRQPQKNIEFRRRLSA